MEQDGHGNPQDANAQRGRKFIGVKFECCGVYSRIYYNDQKQGYFGYCPLCHRRVNVRVDPEKGIDARFFNLKIR